MINIDDIEATQDAAVFTFARLAALLRVPSVTIEEFDDDIGHRLAVLDDAIVDLAQRHGVDDLDALVPLDEVKEAVLEFRMPDATYSHLAEITRTGRLAENLYVGPVRSGRSLPNNTTIKTEADKWR